MPDDTALPSQNVSSTADQDGQVAACEVFVLLIALLVCFRLIGSWLDQHGQTGLHFVWSERFSYAEDSVFVGAKSILAYKIARAMLRRLFGIS